MGKKDENNDGSRIKRIRRMGHVGTDNGNGGVADEKG